MYVTRIIVVYVFLGPKSILHSLYFPRRARDGAKKNFFPLRFSISKI